jgi:hypothetical protein
LGFQIAMARRNAGVDREVCVPELAKMAAGVGQLVGEAGKGTLGLGDQPRAGDPQCKLQVSTEAGDPRLRLTLGRNPVDASQAAEKNDRGMLSERAQPKMAAPPKVDNKRRLVTSTAHVLPPGNSGRTCATRPRRRVRPASSVPR